MTEKELNAQIAKALDYPFEPITNWAGRLDEALRLFEPYDPNRLLTIREELEHLVPPRWHVTIDCARDGSVLTDEIYVAHNRLTYALCLAWLELVEKRANLSAP